ncbi:MAG: NAD(P)-binding domain-containing protein [Dehalococcoidia bacterium]
MGVAIVGLGRMGMGIAARLRRDGDVVVGHDRNPEVSDVGSPGRVSVRRARVAR